MICTPIKLDKTRNMLLGFGAMQLFKKITGKSLTKVNWDEEDTEDILPILYYCGLKHEDESLDIEKTIRLLDEHLGIKGASELLPQIFKDAGLSAEDDIKNAQGTAVK